MKIIDAHLHIFPEDDAATAACSAEAEAALRHLWEPLGIVRGVGGAAGGSLFHRGAGAGAGGHTAEGVLQGLPGAGHPAEPGGSGGHRTDIVPGKQPVRKAGARAEKGGTFRK